MNAEFRETGKKPYLIVEPGISMVVNPFTFVSKVIETKKFKINILFWSRAACIILSPTMQIVRQKRQDGNAFPVVFFYKSNLILYMKKFNTNRIRNLNIGRNQCKSSRSFIPLIKHKIPRFLIRTDNVFLSWVQFKIPRPVSL